MSLSSIKLGKYASAKTTVTELNTAKAVGSGSLDVFSTPMMIALMEQAACECLTDALEEGQTSVGTTVAVTHNAASKLGAEIIAEAKIKSVDGRKVEFIVTARDGVKEIGVGTHTRFIVDTARFIKNI